MTHCRFIAKDSPRLVCANSHERGESCDECSQCPEHHCRVCYVSHAEHACPGCLDEARTNLADIARLCGALPTEAMHRGITSEAFVLLGPAADPEARGHMAASVSAGRVPSAYLESADDEHHPLFVAATWGSVYREAFEHDEPTGRMDLTAELGYLGRNLTEAGAFPWVPFEDFARDLRRCVGHLEAVLHDSERGERTNIDCLDCGAALERRLSASGFEDVATCRGCKRRYTGPEYSFAITAHYIAEADWLSDDHMAQRTRVLASTIRSWARTPKDGSPALIRKEVQHGRVVFSVEDVERVKAEKGHAA